MCGIAGLILDEPNPQCLAWLSSMTQRLIHRGPDDGGAVVFGPGGLPITQRSLGGSGDTISWGHVGATVGLGSRRLAVIDTSPAGHQPMACPDQRIWLVYNGEIYNHAELRSELRHHGMTFSGSSDTEVLLAAYRAWGQSCFSRLEGMWAAMVVDWGARVMLWSRDRLGIKPLYVCQFDGGIGLASEIRPLLLLPGANRGVNEARLRDFLSEGLVDHTDDTLFEGMWSIPAGCVVQYDLRAKDKVGTMQTRGAVHRYWQPDTSWGTQANTASNVQRSLSNAVRSHLRSDVLVGSCLSGGLDSSAVVSLVHRFTSGGAHAEQIGNATHDAIEHNWSQHTFTASLPGSPFDETHHAEAVIAACSGLNPHYVQPTAERLLADITALVDHQEQPFGSPSIYLQWEVMRLAKETGVTVLLDGQGGDELFCGYEGFLPSYIAHLLRKGRLLRAAREFFGTIRERHFRTLPLAWHVGAHLLPACVRARWRRSLNAKRQTWLDNGLFEAEESPGMCKALNLAPPDVFDGDGGTPAFAKHLWTVLLRNSLPSLLRFEDRNSMAFSVEARVPFLDRRLVELAMALPPSEKINAGRMKVVLRKAVEGIVPDSISARRDKIGFIAPTDAWMRGGLHDWWHDLVASDSFRDRGCFQPDGVAQLITRFHGGDTSATIHLWRLAIVEQWARQFLDT